MFLDFRMWLFVLVARMSPRLPAFRGRTRIFLLLHSWLGLAHHRLLVDAKMRRPVEFLVKLDVQSWLQRLAFLTGEYESETVLFLEQLRTCRLDQGYVLDIGANVGMITIPLALMSKNQSAGGQAVVAVEAVPDNVAALQANIFLNNLTEDVRVLAVALGEVEKSIFIEVEGGLKAGQGSGTANILPDGSSYECEKQELELTTIDHLAESLVLNSGCSVIKIDTDGYDLKVLQGAVDFLAENRPVIFGEFSAHCMNWHHQTIEDVQAFAEHHGYRVFFRKNRIFRFSSTLPVSGFVQDLLLVPNETAEAVRWCIDD